MKNIYEKIITEIKKMEYKGMIATMIVSIMLFIADILHLVLKFDFCDFYRHFYVFAFSLSFIFFMNKQGREERLEKERVMEELKKEMKEQKTNASYIMPRYKAVIPIIDIFPKKQKNILYQFVANNNSVITITKNVPNTLHEIQKINYCLNGLDLNIKIRTATPYLILEIDKRFLTILKLTFSEGLTKIK